MAKTVQEQLQESYLMMRGILSEEDNQVVTDILALDEISKATLGSYINKAVADVGGGLAPNAYAMGQSSMKSGIDRNPEREKKELRKTFARIKGIKNATNRLTKEQKETIESILEELEKSS